MIDDESSDEGTKDTKGDESDAAQHDSGQEQKPKQAGETDSMFDSEQHSDAPGPFGTGSSATPGSETEDDADQDD